MSKLITLDYQGLTVTARKARLFEMAAPIRTGLQTALNGGAA